MNEPSTTSSGHCGILWTFLDWLPTDNRLWRKQAVSNAWTLDDCHIITSGFRAIAIEERCVGKVRQRKCGNVEMWKCGDSIAFSMCSI